jgi:transaldolase
MNKIKIFLDGPSIMQLKKFNHKKIDGYTFNPTLFKINKAKNYIKHAKEIIKLCNNRPISLEVIADNEKDMINQAEILNKLNSNIYVKIPICFTNGKSTKKVIQNLLKKNFKLNITAIFTLSQIIEIESIIKNYSSVILSVFVGRIFDAGEDGEKIMKKINNYVHKKTTCKTLWASTRMPYDIIKAKRIGTDIITMGLEQIKKIDKFGYSLTKYSKDTVLQFFNDAKSSGFKIN